MNYPYKTSKKGLTWLSSASPNVQQEIDKQDLTVFKISHSLGDSLLNKSNETGLRSNHQGSVVSLGNRTPVEPSRPCRFVWFIQTSIGKLQTIPADVTYLNLDFVANIVKNKKSVLLFLIGLVLNLIFYVLNNVFFWTTPYYDGNNECKKSISTDSYKYFWFYQIRK